MEGTDLKSDLINNSTREGVIKEDSCPNCAVAQANNVNETCEKFACNCENELDISIDTEDDAATAFSYEVPKNHGKSSVIHRKRINAKLRTSKDIYDGLKWDSESISIQSSKKELDNIMKLDTSLIYIGYKDRFLGMCELPLEEYNPGGDIPFHRIFYFRTGGPPVLPFIGKDGEVKVREDNLPEGTVFIWDRESRTDLVFKSGNSTAF